MSEVLVAIAAMCVVLLWFGLMAAFAAAIYETLKNGYFDLLIMPAGALLLMIAVTCVVAANFVY